MTCEDFGGRAHDYLFDALEAPDRAAFEEHLRSCESCRARLEEARRGAEKLKEWRVPAAPARAVENSVIAANLRERAKRPGLRRALKIAGLGLAAAAAVYVVALLGYAEHVRTLRPSPQDLLLLADPAWVPGTRASARVLLKNRSTGEPVAGAEVVVRLASRNAPEAREESWTARTDASGSAAVEIPVPDWADGEYALEVRADSAFGKDALDRPLTLHRPLKVLVSTDKPIYQPSQEIKIRVLCLFAATQKPAAGEEARVEVLNPNGIKVFKAALRLSPFGIGSCALPLADELDLGAYRIAATVRGVTTEKVVTVKKYVLPKFKVEVRTERDFYLPGETLAGEVKTSYFFGKPVAGGRVAIRSGDEAPDLEASGETDRDGRWKFRMTLPDSWIGIPLEQGKGRLGLEIEAVDTAGHAERTTKEITVASDPFDVFLFPEGGRVAEGVENRFYLYLSWPDGRPCDAEVGLRFGTGETRDVRTGAAGLSVFAARYDGRFFPVECAIRAGGAPPFAKAISPAGGLETVP
ncbi:MAG: MG2 domain-containing protein, partial [Planctomycetes bacterium]|nr:MG2 domain-containing protein [Planctomycetota bacterium]